MRILAKTVQSNLFRTLERNRKCVAIQAHLSKKHATAATGELRPSLLRTCPPPPPGLHLTAVTNSLAAMEGRKARDQRTGATQQGELVWLSPDAEVIH